MRYLQQIQIIMKSHYVHGQISSSDYSCIILEQIRFKPHVICQVNNRAFSLMDKNSNSSTSSRSKVTQRARALDIEESLGI